MKQVIVLRRDLNMRKGKMCVQSCHASMAAILDNGHVIPSPEISAWLSGNFTKVCVGVDSEEELFEVYRKADEAGLHCSIVRDLGLTEFHGVPTLTAVAVGPGKPEDVDKITGHLKLL